MPSLRSRPSPLPRSSKRAAFTLLEMMFALGLSLLLMTALFAAIELYRRVTTAGRSEVERAQLVRAVLRMIESDVRSCSFRVDESVSSDGTETDAEGATETVVVDAAEAIAGQSPGLSGDTTGLTLHVSRPTRPPGGSGPAASDSRSVSWFLVPPAVENGTGSGLARLEGDRLELESADTAGDMQTLAQFTRLIAPEVNFLEFRYFDGTQWLDAWDSATYERLPNAVEITIGFRSDAEATGVSAAAVGVSPSSNLYRFVIALPTAEPSIPNTTSTAF